MPRNRYEENSRSLAWFQPVVAPVAGGPIVRLEWNQARLNDFSVVPDREGPAGYGEDSTRFCLENLPS
jgi:hypothetical protein